LILSGLKFYNVKQPLTDVEFSVKVEVDNYYHGDL